MLSTKHLQEEVFLNENERYEEVEYKWLESNHCLNLISDCRVDKDVLFFRPTLEEQTYISDYLQKKYSALDGALGS